MYLCIHQQYHEYTIHLSFKPSCFSVIAHFRYLMTISTFQPNPNTYSLILLSQLVLFSLVSKVATTFVVGQPMTKDLSAYRVASETSSRQVAVHISHTRIRCFNLNVVLDLKYNNLKLYKRNVVI